MLELGNDTKYGSMRYLGPTRTSMYVSSSSGIVRARSVPWLSKQMCAPRKLALCLQDNIRGPTLSQQLLDCYGVQTRVGRQLPKHYFEFITRMYEVENKVLCFSV